MSQSLQLDKLLVYILLLILKYEANFKHSKDRRNGLQWLNAFVVIEQLLILLSFSKENICLPNGLLLPILIEGWRFLVQTKGGPAIFTVWSGFDDALSQSHEKKRMVVGGFWFWMESTSLLDFILHCREHRIILLRLIPHTCLAPQTRFVP